MSETNFAFCTRRGGRVAVLGALLITAVAAAACNRTPATPAAVSADTWAVVNGKAITQADVDTAFRRSQGAAQTLSPEEVLTAKLNLLNDLIVQEILLAKAPAFKLEVSQQELDTAYANARKDMSDDTVKQELAKRNLTPDDMREALRRELLTQKILDYEVGAKVAVSDKEITDFFEANRQQFNVPEESYHIAQIVVTPARDPRIANSTGNDAATPQEAAAKVQMLLERLKGGASFRDLALQFSEDPESGPRGGDLGFVGVSRLQQAPPQLRNAVLGKTPGSVNVASVGGAYTLVLVVAHEQPGQRDLSTPGLRERISETLRARKEQLLRMAYLTAVRSDATVVNYVARRVVESKGQLPATTTAKASGT